MAGPYNCADVGLLAASRSVRSRASTLAPAPSENAPNLASSSIVRQLKAEFTKLSAHVHRSSHVTLHGMCGPGCNASIRELSGQWRYRVRPGFQRGTWVRRSRPLVPAN
jgi:hypothetical protein